MIERVDSGLTIVARDCSLIPLNNREDEDWLRRLVSTVKPADVLLGLAHRNGGADDEPIALFDSTSGTWWAGRYVGEIQYEDRTLRIEPRFGMPVLMRWLTTIWGVRVFDSKGRYKQQQIWLWLVIAHLWAGQLISAAKHGLPFRRIETIYHGRSLRGRLLVRETALAHAIKDDRLTSMTRIRLIDPDIGNTLLAAFERLCAAIGSQGEKNYWLPDRGKALISDLQAALGSRTDILAASGRKRIRYSPITENYRSVIELSQSILACRPRTAASGEGGKAVGVLLDMAEIWELYVAKLLQVGLPGLQVSHTGRATEHFRWLLTSPTDGDKLGSLRPDIIIADNRGRNLAIVDAKYKATRINTGNRIGVHTDDLYQLTAYLSGFGDPNSHMDGFLIYPADEAGQVAQRLAPKNPWQISSMPKRNLWFISTSCESDADAHTLSEAERAMTSTIHAAIANNST